VRRLDVSRVLDYEFDIYGSRDSSVGAGDGRAGLGRDGRGTASAGTVGFDDGEDIVVGPPGGLPLKG
jgi:hypothetical protein